MGTLLENQSGLTRGWEDTIRSLLGLKWLTNGLNGKSVVLIIVSQLQGSFLHTNVLFAFGIPIDVTEFRVLLNHSIYRCVGKNEVMFPSASHEVCGEYMYTCTNSLC
jgi:hypothetical protein